MELSELLTSAPLLPGLDHPFDRFQRHRDVQLVLTRMALALGRSRLRVLDVGGVELTQQFLPEHDIVVTNLAREQLSSVQSSGAALPFADHAFDVVLTVDTLEHIPPAERKAFLAEMVRVAKHYVLITGPFSSPINDEAERLLDDFIYSATGQHHYYLAEHLRFGLPLLPTTLEQLNASGCQSITVPSGCTPRWLAMMLLRFSLPDTAHGHRTNSWLEKLYNHQFYWADHCEPSYRQIVVAAKQADIGAVRDIVDLFAAGRNAFGQPDFAHLLALWQAVAATRTFDAYEQTIADLQAQRAQLEARIRGLESGRFMRTMAALHRLRNRVP
ncbi:MAG TPA: class I SAM-dependent methyltransferase [Chloroflexi bacterium]|nr:class I SAM-dependent methyltransferase [Chloroflexota bacterium]